MQLNLPDTRTPEERAATRCAQNHPFFYPRVRCEEQAAYACDHCGLYLCTFHLFLGPAPERADLCTQCWERVHAQAVARILTAATPLGEPRPLDRRWPLARARQCLRRLADIITCKKGRAKKLAPKGGAAREETRR